MRNIFIASLVAVVSTAAGAQGTHYATISVSKIDVANGQASGELRQRITNAIERVCGSNADVANLEQFAEMSRCRRAARADADRQLAKPTTGVRTAARTR